MLVTDTAFFYELQTSGNPASSQSISSLFPGEDAGKIIEVTAKDLECEIHVDDKVAAGFERTDSSFERGSTVGKTLSNTIACYRETVCERKERSM